MNAASLSSPDKTGRAQRREPRHKTFRVVTLAIGGARHRAHMLDVSRSGARIHSDVAIESDAHVALQIDDRAIHARVMWARDKRLGLAFLVPLLVDDAERIAAA